MNAVRHATLVAPFAGQRILVVEDEFFIADDIATTLSEAGAEVLGPFASIRRVLEFLAGQPKIDAAVLDLDVRGEKSYPVADELRRRGIPHVFSTGYDPSAIPAPHNTTPRLEKPYDVAILPEILSRLLS